MREWQAGDLVLTPSGAWGVLRKRGDGWRDDVSGEYAEIGRAALDAGGFPLLAAADADLWDALRGLPGVNAVAGDWGICVPLAPGFDMHICTPESNHIYPPFMRGPVDHTDTALLEQAIQRFKAIKQYIEVQNGNV